MFLKLMSNEDAPDGDSRKGFRLIECTSARFERVPATNGKHPEPERAVVYIEYPDRETICEALDGNAYLMNDNGKTVAAFGIASIP